ncbi:MAG: gamma-glutamyltransferase [Bryobacteraceae bacterium]
MIALALALLLAAGASAQTAGQRPFWRTVVMGTNGMVAAEHPLEAMAGFQVLQGGGNAIDAAVAVFYMTTVVESHQAGIGGDAFILAWLAKEKRVVFINGTGFAPRAATRKYYEELKGIPADGPPSILVPGAVAGFDHALKRYGTRRYPELLKPAIEAAANGHAVSHWSASHHVSGAPKLAPYPSSMRVLTRSGEPFFAGQLFVQRDLARTFQTIAKEGAQSFYRGAIARNTARFAEANGILLRLADLESVEAEEAEPIRVSYKDYEIYQCPPNSQGIVLLLALNILEGYDLRSMGALSPDALHLTAESLKLAFADRDRYIADPRFAKDIPVPALLSKDYAAKRRALIRMDRAIEGVAPPGDPRQGNAVLAGHRLRYAERTSEAAAAPILLGDQGETSSFSIADRFGNVVSVTHSVNGTFGSGIVVEGGGFVLNNRMPYFSLDPDNVNVLEPGKRPRHTINPAIALREGRPVLAWNTPGGDNQPQAMLQAFLNVAEFGMNVQQAVEAPTVTTKNIYASMYPQKPGDALQLPRVLAAEVGDALRARGHKLDVTELQGPYFQQPSGAGAVKMIWIDPKSGIFHGSVSPAKDNYVIGW